MLYKRYIPALVAPGIGIINGSAHSDRESAELFLSDRIANGEAFPGERVARIPARVFTNGCSHVLVIGHYSSGCMAGLTRSWYGGRQLYLSPEHPACGRSAW